MRLFSIGIVSSGLLSLAAALPLHAEEPGTVPDRLDKAISPDMAPGVRDVAGFVAEAGYLLKGAAPVGAQDDRVDVALKADAAAPAVETPEEAVAPDIVEAAATMEAMPAEPAPDPVDYPEDAAALYALGLDLMDGRAPDPGAAAEAFARAAEAGHPGAMFELGAAFEAGRGVEADLGAAVRWYERAVDGGDPRAMNNLGWLYAHGLGVAREVETAVALYRQGAEAGEPSAMSNLGWMLENGIGTGQDLAQAARWYARAADADDAQAMLALGNLHLVGDGVGQDPAQALVWFARARAAGRAEALSYMGEVFEKTDGFRDPQRAAGFYLRALEAGDRWPLSRASRSWDAETAVALQTLLAERGLYEGEIDGAIGPVSRGAMQRLVPATGK